MKKLFCLLLTLSLLLALCACGETDPNLGVYTCTSVEYQGITMTGSEVYPGGLSLELRGGGRAVLDDEGEKGNLKWKLDGTDFTLEASDGTSKGTLINGVITLELLDSGLTVTLVKDGASAPQLTQELPIATQPDATAEPAEPAVSVPAWWSGDFYGWWMIDNSTGSYQNQSYDAFAEISLNSDGSVYLKLWDEDCSRGDPFAELITNFEETDTELGRLVSDSGYFYSNRIGAGEIVIDPDEYDVADCFVIDGHYTDDAQNFDYQIVLRPWGTDWSDLEENLRPIFYEDWYLPLIREGKGMPDSIPQELVQSQYS